MRPLLRAAALATVLPVPAGWAQDTDAPPDPPKKLEGRDVVAAAPATGATAKETADLTAVPTPPPLDAPLPAADDSPAWLLLDTGEWLQGDLKRLRLGAYTFKSANLGEVTLDADDVLAFWAPRGHVWILRDRTRLIGPSMLRDGILTVQDADGVRDIPRDHLAAMTAGQGKELAYWTYALYAGFSGRWGNAQQLAFNSHSDLVRDDGRLRWTLHYDGTYGVASGTPATNNHTARTDLNAYVSPVFYVTALTAEAYHDPFQNLRIRSRNGAGFGFRHEATAAFTWSGALTAVYQYQEALSVADEADRVSNDAGIALALDALLKPATDLSITLGWASTVVVTNLGSTSHRGLFGLSYKLAGAIGIDTRVQYDRIEQPVTAADGTAPVSDDVLLTAGLSLSF